MKDKFPVRFKRLKHSTLLLLPVFLLIAVVSCEDNSSGPELHQWTEQESGSNRALSGVWGMSAHNVFAVGNRGTILHFDGTSWSEMNSGTTQLLRAIWGSSGNDIFAVGSLDGILHYNGSEWSQMPSERADLYGVYGTSATDVYAVGAGGIILHYDGQSWNRIESGTTQSFRAVWCSLERIHPGMSQPILSVVVAGYGPPRHYDGEYWSEIAPNGNYYGVWGTRWNDVFLTMLNGNMSHFNGSGSRNPWGRIASGYLNDAWGSSGDNVFAVGYGGTIIHYDGDTWSTMKSSTRATLTSVWGSGEGDVFAVGTSGTILHYGP